MRKLDPPSIVIYLAILAVGIPLILILVGWTSPDTPSTRPPGCLIYRDGRCPSEMNLSAPPIVVDTIPTIDTTSTTSTTIDTPPPTTTSTTTTVPEYRNTPATVSTSVDWDLLADCETGGDWTANTGNGYAGGLQFAHGPDWSTWLAYGGTEFAPHPWEATREQQIEIGERILASAGPRAWPGCARRYGWLR